ncbi:35362_t:CDS:2, partial [Racocetra persica]
RPQNHQKGGYAVVYSVIFQGKRYALKSLNINLSFDDKAFNQFKRELKLLYMVNHPNIVKFHGILRDITNVDSISIENIPIVIMYLTKGNGLSFELATNHNYPWTLYFEKDSHVETIAPKNLSELIYQEIRQKNTYFCASFYAITNFYHI